MNLESHVILPDGRRLSYAEFGQPDSVPVLYFHGAPSSRLEPLIIGDETLRRHGLRIIAPDRPGMGRSDSQPNRRFSAWPQDVLALADSLGLKKFAVLGYSGGGPYAAICAARIPERLAAVVIVSGGWQMIGPEIRELPFPNRLMLTFARRAPLLLRLMLKAMGAMGQGEPAKELAEMKKRVPPADHAAFAEPGRLEAFGRVIRESLHQGTSGAAWDLRLYVREFDFRLDEVRRPLTIFHGAQDANVPISMVRRVIRELPDAQLVTFENDAHISTLCSHFDEIAEALSVKSGV